MSLSEKPKASSQIINNPAEKEYWITALSTKSSPSPSACLFFLLHWHFRDQFHDNPRFTMISLIASQICWRRIWFIQLLNTFRNKFLDTATSVSGKMSTTIFKNKHEEANVSQLCFLLCPFSFMTCCILNLSFGFVLNEIQFSIQSLWSFVPVSINSLSSYVEIQ